MCVVDNVEKTVRIGLKTWNKNGIPKRYTHRKKIKEIFFQKKIIQKIIQNYHIISRTVRDFMYQTPRKLHLFP